MKSHKTLEDEEFFPEPPPVAAWTQAQPWKSILGDFNTVLIIPLNNERPVVILKHSYKKLSNPSRKITLFDDHRIFWKDSIYLKLPEKVIEQYGPGVKSFLYKNVKVRRFDFENPEWFPRGAYEILELPIQLFNTAGIKINSDLLGEAKKYLGWLGLASDKRGKIANKQAIEMVLKVIIKIFKNTKKLNLRRLPIKEINREYELNCQCTNQDGNSRRKHLRENRSVRGIAYAFRDSIKEQCSKNSDFINKTSLESLQKLYWEFKTSQGYRKTPPPLKSIAE
jgi:hypothetical protein